MQKHLLNQCFRFFVVEHYLFNNTNIKKTDVTVWKNFDSFPVVFHITVQRGLQTIQKIDILTTKLHKCE